jgi:hypothetical protein
VLCVLLFLLCLPVWISFLWENGRGEFAVRWLFVRWKGPSDGEEEQPSEPEKAAEGETKKKKKKFKIPPPEQLTDFVRRMWPKLWRGVRRLIRSTLVYDLQLDLRVCGPDAARTGVRFGRTYAWVCGVLAALQGAVGLRISRVRIEPDFLSREDACRLAFRVRIYPIVILAVAVNLAVAAILAAFRAGIIDFKRKGSGIHGAKEPDQ